MRCEQLVGSGPLMAVTGAAELLQTLELVDLQALSKTASDNKVFASGKQGTYGSSQFKREPLTGAVACSV